MQSLISFKDAQWWFFWGLLQKFFSKKQNIFNNPLDYEYSQVTDIFNNYINAQSKIIDIGCGYGCIINYLNKCVYKNKIGLEPCKDRDKSARYFGLKVINESVYNVDKNLNDK